MSEILRFFSMVIMLFNMCNSNSFNRNQCLSNWDTWLIPELRRAWDIKTRTEVPYQEEKEVLQSNKVELPNGSDQPL